MLSWTTDSAQDSCCYHDGASVPPPCDQIAEDHTGSTCTPQNGHHAPELQLID
jgi:hypothetical protein